MGIVSNSEHIIVYNYDNRLNINGGNPKPPAPDVGQLWYDNDNIAVWNGYSWIPVPTPEQTTIDLSPTMKHAVERFKKQFEEEKLMEEFPELLEAYNQYKSLLETAKIVSKMRNSDLAKNGV